MHLCMEVACPEWALVIEVASGRTLLELCFGGGQYIVATGFAVASEEGTTVHNHGLHRVGSGTEVASERTLLALIRSGVGLHITNTW